MRSTKHVIGSQLVDRAELDAGIHLFADHRKRGYVRPSDLADLILEIGWLTPEASSHSAGSGVPMKVREVAGESRQVVRKRRRRSSGRQRQRASAK